MKRALLHIMCSNTEAPSCNVALFAPLFYPLQSHSRLQSNITLILRHAHCVSTQMVGIIVGYKTFNSFHSVQARQKYIGVISPHCNGWGYTHDRRADKDSHPHDRNVTDDLCSLIKFCFAFIMVNFSTLCVLLLFMLKIIYLKKVLESFKIEKKCITDINKSLKNRWLITAQVIKIKTMIFCICITLLMVTFSVIIVSKIKLWFNWYSFHLHDRFWQVSDTMGMPISQKL